MSDASIPEEHHAGIDAEALGPAAEITATVSEAPPETTPPLLEVRGLQTWFRTRVGEVHAVDGVDLTVRKGEVLGLVGESGSGKSVTMLSVMRLVDQPGRIVSGSVTFDGIDVLALPRNSMRSLRGDRISMIFQQPNASLHPCFTAGVQISEVYEIHRNSRRCRRSRQGRRDAAHRRHPRPEAAGQVVSAPALGRSGPAGDDRHGPRRRAGAAHRRRADHGTRRDDPGADPRPDADAAGRAGHEHGADHPRPRRGRRDGPPCRRDVRRPDRRGGSRRGTVRRPQASLHPWSARLGPGHRRAPRGADGDSRAGCRPFSTRHRDAGSPIAARNGWSAAPWRRPRSSSSATGHHVRCFLHSDATVEETPVTVGGRS